MIDSHVHLDDRKFGSEVEAVISRAAAAGVRAMVSAGVDLESSRCTLKLAEQHPSVYAAVGFHPHEAAKMRPGDLQTLRSLAEHPRVVAIGEIGLDYYRDLAPRDVQRRVLQEQLTLAAELGLPVVIHSREASQDTFQTLSQWASEVTPRYQGRLLGVMHCFSGDADNALDYVALGFYISLAGPVTYPNARKTRDVATRVPLERLLVETDAPYLPPQGQRGQRNEPANVAAVVAEIGRLKETGSEEVACQTSRNAEAVFRLPPDTDL